MLPTFKTSSIICTIVTSKLASSVENSTNEQLDDSSRSLTIAHNCSMRDETIEFSPSRTNYIVNVNSVSRDKTNLKNTPGSSLQNRQNRQNRQTLFSCAKKAGYSLTTDSCKSDSSKKQADSMQTAQRTGQTRCAKDWILKFSLRHVSFTAREKHTHT